MRNYGLISSLNMLMLTIMMSLMAVFAAHAQDDIFIGDIRIAYERGYFDQNTLQGDVSDIRFYSRNDYLGSSERLVLEYDFTGGVFKLNTFLVEGMRINDENVDIYLGQMSIEDMVIDDQFLNTVIDGGISVYRTGDIVVNDLDIEAEGSRISIERFSMSNIPLLPYEGASIPDYDSEFILEKLTIALSPYDPTLAEYHMMLNMLGINDITMNANSIASHRNVGNRYRQVSTADIELVGLGMLETYGDLEYLKPTYHMMNQADFENIEPDQALLMLSSFGSGIFINSLELSYSDKGLMDYALSLAGQTSGMARGDIADMTVITMQAELMHYPDLANMVIPPLEQFIKRGGRLVVSIEPTFSLPIISLLPLISSPAEAINVLGLRVSN